MVTADIESSMSGIFSNPTMIIKASDYVAPGALITETLNTVLGGTVVQGINSGQKLMETGWYGTGVIANNVLLSAKFSVAGGTNFDDTLIVSIVKRDPKDKAAGTSITPIEIPYVNYISPYGGTTNIDITIGRLCTEFLFFDERYEYKFIVSIGRKTTGTYYVDLKYIKLTEIFPTTINSPRQYSLGNSGTYIPIVEGIFWSATTDGSGNLNWDIPLEDSSTYNTSGIRGEYHEVDAVVTGFVSNTDTSTALSSIATYDAGTERNTINVKLYGYAASTLVYFYTIVYGFRRAYAV